MAPSHEFLNPACKPRTLDTFWVRRQILFALRDQLPSFSGTILDIGCGRMPYKSMLLSAPSRAERYLGLDLEDDTTYKGGADLKWDGRKIPMEDNQVEVALATEVLEHCPEPTVVLAEAFRVLKPGGIFFFTVPFLFPLHDVPHDEYRYTPFAMERFLSAAGFTDIQIRSLGGWDASLGQLLGLWVRRRGMRWPLRAALSVLLLPLVRVLLWMDSPPSSFPESQMITGLSGTAVKPKR